MRWTGYVAITGNRRGAYRVSLGRSKGRRALGRRRYRWDYNDKMDLQEVACGGMMLWLRIGTGVGRL
jgi:hypothetical protein